MIKQLKALAAKIPDTIAQENLKPILDEIAAEISPNTLDRMAAFLQNADDPQTADAEKLALAISGWLLGADAATAKLPTAISAYKVRGLIREYLSEATAPDRERTYGYIKQESGGEPAMVAELLAHMKPPVGPPEPVAGKPGYYELEVAGAGQGAAGDVLRPTSAGIRPLSPLSDDRHPPRRHHRRAADRLVGGRLGQGRRAHRPGRPPRLHRDRAGVDRGAPEAIRLFGPRTRRRARLAPRRLPAVLDRHRPRLPFRPFDRRRRGLGHRPGASRSVGGRDSHRGPIRPLLHPLLGERPLRAVLRRRRRTRRRQAHQERRCDLDRYLRRGFDTTVVEYHGRGHEDFYDEILRMFDWMGRFHRNFFPREFACETMRPWDNFFWWVEIARAAAAVDRSIRPTGRRRPARSRCK